MNPSGFYSNPFMNPGFASAPPMYFPGYQQYPFPYSFPMTGQPFYGNRMSVSAVLNFCWSGSSKPLWGTPNFTYEIIVIGLDFSYLFSFFRGNWTLEAVWMVFPEKWAVGSGT